MGGSLVVAGLLLALLCLVLFAGVLPSVLARYHAYTTAVPCPASAPAARSEECLRTVAFTVEATRTGPYTKNGTYRATLSGSPYWNGVVAFGGPGPLLDRLRPGDRVTGTVWRGEVTALAADGVRQPTAEEPRSDSQATAAGATLVGLLAALLLVFGAVRLVRPGRCAPFVWRGYGVPLCLVALAACVASGGLALWLGLPWWTAPLVAVPVTAYPAVRLYRRRAPAAAGAGTGGAGTAC